MRDTGKYRVEENTIAGYPVRVTSYRIGDTFFCHIDNKDPGATIARDQGETRAEACRRAVARAEERLK